MEISEFSMISDAGVQGAQNKIDSDTTVDALCLEVYEQLIKLMLLSICLITLFLTKFNCTIARKSGNTLQHTESTFSSDTHQCMKRRIMTER